MRDKMKLPKLKEFNQTEREVRAWGYVILSNPQWTEKHNQAMEAINSPSLFVGLKNEQ